MKGLHRDEAPPISPMEEYFRFNVTAVGCSDEELNALSLALGSFGPAYEFSVGRMEKGERVCLWHPKVTYVLLMDRHNGLKRFWGKLDLAVVGSDADTRDRIFDMLIAKVGPSLKSTMEFVVMANDDTFARTRNLRSLRDADAVAQYIIERISNTRCRVECRKAAFALVCCWSALRWRGLPSPPETPSGIWHSLSSLWRGRTEERTGNLRALPRDVLCMLHAEVLATGSDARWQRCVASIPL